MFAVLVEVGIIFVSYPVFLRCFVRIQILQFLSGVNALWCQYLVGSASSKQFINKPSVDCDSLGSVRIRSLIMLWRTWRGRCGCCQHIIPADPFTPWFQIDRYSYFLLLLTNLWLEQRTELVSMILPSQPSIQSQKPECPKRILRELCSIWKWLLYCVRKINSCNKSEIPQVGKEMQQKKKKKNVFRQQKRDKRKQESKIFCDNVIFLTRKHDVDNQKQTFPQKDEKIAMFLGVSSSLHQVCLSCWLWSFWYFVLNINSELSVGFLVFSWVWVERNFCIFVKHSLIWKLCDS